MCNVQHSMYDIAGVAKSSANISTSKNPNMSPQVRTLKTGNVASSASSAVVKPSATKLALALLREKGLRGLFKGYSPTLLRDVTFSAFYFPMFAHFNSMVGV